MGIRVNEIIADKIEEIIGNMFRNIDAFGAGVTEYSILYDPRKHASWFIVLFFADRSKQKDALKDGACYQMHSYLLDELKIYDETRNIDRMVVFESGTRPVEKSEIENLMERLANKHNQLTSVAGNPDIKDCANCGHDFDKHQLLCNLNENQETPTAGWIVCPEEDCTCFQTWGANWKPGPDN